MHGVNHNQPFPTATSLHKIFTSFTIFIVFQCFRSFTSLPRNNFISMFGCVGRDCGGVLGGVELFGVVLVILLVKNFAISVKVATFVTANEGYAS